MYLGLILHINFRPNRNRIGYILVFFKDGKWLTESTSWDTLNRGLGQQWTILFIYVNYEYLCCKTKGKAIKRLVLCYQVINFIKLNVFNNVFKIFIVKTKLTNMLNSQRSIVQST